MGDLKKVVVPACSAWSTPAWVLGCESSFTNGNTGTAMVDCWLWLSMATYRLIVVMVLLRMFQDSATHDILSLSCTGCDVRGPGKMQGACSGLK